MQQNFIQLNDIITIKLISNEEIMGTIKNYGLNECDSQLYIENAIKLSHFIYNYSLLPSKRNIIKDIEFSAVMLGINKNNNIIINKDKILMISKADKEMIDRYKSFIQTK